MGRETGTFNIEGGTCIQQGKEVLQDGIVIYNGKDESVANSLVAGYNKKLADHQAMALATHTSELAYENAKKLSLLNFDLTNQQIDANIARFPSNTDLALKEASKAALDLNKMMADAFYGALDDMLPSWREDLVGAAGTAQADSIEMTEAFKKNVLPKAMAAADEMSVQALDNINAQLRGEIPEDVAHQLRTRAAEVSAQLGVRGQAAKQLTARDLGLSSLDLMSQGLSQAPAALALGRDAYTGFTQTLQNPVTTGINATNLLKAYIAPQADVQSIYGTNASVLAGASIVPAGTAMQVGAQTISAGAQLAQSAYFSGLEYASQSQWNTQNWLLQNKSIEASKSMGKMSMWGNLAGAAMSAGGDVGAAYLAS